MPFRWIEVLADESREDAVREVARNAEVSEVVVQPLDEGRRSIRLLTGEIDRQALIDELLDCLEEGGHGRVVLTATEAVTPKTEAEEKREHASIEKSEKDSITATREEIVERVVQGATTSRDFLTLVTLSTIIATVGLLKNDVAVLIGAMVIAPLLGPNLALAFGSAVGDRKLAGRALGTAAIGTVITVALAALIARVQGAEADSPAIAVRTASDLGSVALALASGAAAALSITSGVSGMLVGVTVSVALLPPAAAAGVALSVGAVEQLSGAAILFLVNSVGVTLAALLTFLAKGVRPRSWHQRKGATQSLRVTVPILILALAALAGLIYVDAYRAVN